MKAQRVSEGIPLDEQDTGERNLVYVGMCRQISNKDRGWRGTRMKIPYQFIFLVMKSGVTDVGG